MRDKAYNIVVRRWIWATWEREFLAFVGGMVFALLVMSHV